LKMEENDNKLQEMQMTEQSLQNLLMQKQAFQMELSETTAALKEISDSGEEVYKIVGQLMIRTDKKKMQDELQNKEKLLELRLKTIEKQEATLTEQLEKVRAEVMKGMKK